MGNYTSIPEEYGVDLYTLLDSGDSIDKAVTRKVTAYEIKFYLQDNTSQWIDLSDRVDVEGVNRLISLASLTIKAEDKEDGGSFSTTLSGVSLDNHDGFFDDHIESSLQEAGTGDTADFAESKNWQENVFYRNQCKVVARFHLSNGTFLDYTLGVFLVERFETSYPFGTAEMTITGLSKPLMEESAEKVKGGNDWYRRVPIPFLVRALLESYYGQPLDNNWMIHTILELKTANNGSEKYISRYGRPPSLIGTNLGTATEQISYNVSTEETRAICVWELGTELPDVSLTYVRTVAGSPYILKFDSIPFVATDGIYPAAGDLIEIYNKTGINENNGNAGFYVIDKVEVETTTLKLTLRTELPGLTEGGQEAYHIHRVYMGIGEKLYYWIPKRDIYVLVDAGISGKNIRRLWYNKNNGKVYGAAWTTPDMYGDIRVSIDFFKLNNTEIHWMSVDGTPAKTQVVTGEICIYPAATNASKLGHDGVAFFGENLTVPFRQQVGWSTANTYGINWYKRKDALETDGVAVSSEYIADGTLDYKREFEKGAYYFDIVGSPVWYYASLGQVGCILYNPDITLSSDGYIFYTRDSSGSVGQATPSYSYVLLKVSDWSITNLQNTPNPFTNPLFPMCGCSADRNESSGSKYFYFVGTYFNTAEGNGKYRSYLYKLDIQNWTTAVPVLLWSSPDSGGMDIPLDIISLAINNGNSFNILLSGIHDRTGVTGNSTTAPTAYSVGLNTMTPTTAIGRGSPFIHLEKEISRFSYSRRVIGIDPELGQLFSYRGLNWTVSSTNSYFKALDNYNTLTDLDFNCYSNLAIAYKQPYDNTDENNIFTIVYGISSPHYDNDLMKEAVIGEYVLWKFENSLSISPPVADFSGMKIWEAISELAKSGMCVTNFDNQGNFFFVNRSQETPYDRIYSIYDSDDNYPIVSIDKSRAFDEIYNICNFTPSKLTLSETEFGVMFKTRSTGIYLSEEDFLLNYTSNNKIGITLHCETGGILYADGYAGTNYLDVVRSKWKWLIETDVVETFITSTNVIGTTTTGIVLGDTTDVTTNKLAVVTLSDQTEAVMKITSVTSATNTIEWSNTNASITGLTDVASDLFPAGTIVKIMDAATLGYTMGIQTSSLTPSYWSSDGITYLTVAADKDWTGNGLSYLTVNDISHISIGNYLLLEEENLTTGVIRTSQYYFKVISLDTTNKRVYFTWGDEVATGSALDASADFAINTKIKAYWVPFVTSQATEIGGSGIRVSIGLNSISDTQSYFYFEAGDNIHISNEGMKLESASEQKVVISNATSIGKYGRKEYSMNDSKFMQKIVAQVLAQNIVAEYADPKYILTVTTLMDPTLTLTNSSGVINRVKVRCKELFPRSAGYERKCKIRQIQHNFRNFTSQLTLKDVDAY